MEETEKLPEKPKKRPFEGILSSLGALAGGLGLTGNITRLRDEILEAQAREERAQRAAALGLENQAAPSSSDKNTGSLPEYGERAALDYRALAESLLRASEQGRQREPKQCRFIVRYGQQRALNAIIAKRLIPYDNTALSDNAFGLPKKVLRRIANRSNLSDYTPEEIAWLFIDWYFETCYPPENLTLKASLPIDLALEMIALHVERGYDPPWVDWGFSININRFKEGINRASLSPSRPLEVQGRALYEVFLAYAYPELADPAIQIITPPPVEKPLAPETPRKKPRNSPKQVETPGNAPKTPKGSRKRRALEVAPLEPNFYRKKR